jgi:hypothetical protein
MTETTEMGLRCDDLSRVELYCFCYLQRDQKVERSPASQYLNKYYCDGYNKRHQV